MSLLRRGNGIALVSLLVLSLGGCIGGKPANPAATQPATAIDPERARPAYWLNQPAAAEVSNANFQKLWDTSETVARQYLFSIDLRDFRQGLLTTQPMVSKQWFEPWRKDAGTFRDVEENSLGAIRRTIHFQFARNLDGTYTVTPKVVVERQVVVEKKYLEELQTPGTYWYALRRDTALETKLAASIERKLWT
jgi:hypothetical protein